MNHNNHNLTHNKINHNNDDDDDDDVKARPKSIRDGRSPVPLLPTAAINNNNNNNNSRAYRATYSRVCLASAPGCTGLRWAGPRWTEIPYYIRRKSLTVEGNPLL